MGSSSSVTDSGNEQVQQRTQLKARVKALGALAEHGRDRAYKRQTIRAFIEKQKRENREITTALNRGPEEEINRSTESLEIPDNIELNCSICGVITSMFNGYSCRVCSQQYHKKCLKARGDLDEKIIEDTDLIYDTLGWSCPECESIFTLLSPEEINDLSKHFEEMDENNDSKISLDEYLTYQTIVYQDIHDKKPSSFEIDMMLLQFRRIDSDGNGTINYSEFLSQEAIKYLGRRDPIDLVSLLTRKELHSARTIFNQLDEDGDGQVSGMEGHLKYYGFYRALHNDNLRKGKEGCKSQIMARRRLAMLMEADIDGDRVITWDEYIHNQALYILSSRPNASNRLGAFVTMDL